MVLDETIIGEISETLEMLIEEEDLSSKIETSLTNVSKQIKPNLGAEGILKVQDELENISNMNNLNNFCRTELINLVALIESAINS